MHLAFIGSLGSFNLHPQVSVLFLEDISRSHDSQVVLEALGKIFAQLKVKQHDLLDADLPVRQVDHVDLLNAAS